jgi:peptidoglycan-associated lipoprotein
MKNAALILLAAAVLAGCASKETKTEAQVDDRSTNRPGANTAQGSATTPNRPTTSPQGDPLKAGQLAQRSVYFDYDSNSVKDEYRGLVQAHSRYLTGEKRDARIRIEGNCDERGSREYNLALGQRRAESVKKVMTVLGVSDGRIETVSYGEEKPVAGGHDEQAWSQNRRADIRYAGE